MKAAVIRKLSGRPLGELEAAIETLIEEERAPDWVEGDDLGEKLTHLNLAREVATAVSEGTPQGEAFRAVLGRVRALMKND